MNVSALFFSVLCGLSLANTAFLPLIPFDKIGKNFFGWMIVLSIVLIAPFFWFDPYATITAQELGGGPLSALAFSALRPALWIYAASLGLLLILLRRPQNPPYSPRLFLLPILTGLALLIFDGWLFTPRVSTNGFWPYLFVPTLFASSAALFGATLFAMMLGHWYLVQFDLDKRLLKLVAWLYCATLGIRFCLIAAGFGIYHLTGAFGPGDLHNMTSLEGHGIFFWMRVLIGLGLPAILAYMIYETARIGANQSCTGLLYIAVVFVFMGEMVSRYMFFLKGLPL